MNKKTRQLINDISVFMYFIIAIGFALFLLSIGVSQLEKGYEGDGIGLIIASLYIFIILHGLLIVHGLRYVLNQHDKSKEENIKN